MYWPLHFRLLPTLDDHHGRNRRSQPRPQSSSIWSSVPQSRRLGRPCGRDQSTIGSIRPESEGVRGEIHESATSRRLQNGWRWPAACRRQPPRCQHAISTLRRHQQFRQTHHRDHAPDQDRRRLQYTSHAYPAYPAERQMGSDLAARRQ